MSKKAKPDPQVNHEEDLQGSDTANDASDASATDVREGGPDAFEAADPDAGADPDEEVIGSGDQTEDETEEEVEYMLLDKGVSIGGAIHEDIKEPVSLSPRMANEMRERGIRLVRKDAQSF